MIGLILIPSLSHGEKLPKGISLFQNSITASQPFDISQGQKISETLTLKYKENGDEVSGSGYEILEAGGHL